MNEINLSKEHDQHIKTIIDTLSTAKKATSIHKFYELIHSLYSESLNTPLSVIQKFSIMFYSFYNHLEPKSQNKEIKKLIGLSNFMMNNLQMENIFPYLYK